MLERFTRRVSLAIAPDRVTLVQHSGGRRSTARIAAEWVSGAASRSTDPLAGQVAAVLAQASVTGLGLRVLLADALVRSWTVQPPSNANRLQDCEAAAAMRFAAVFGDNPADWCISAAYDARHRFLACALPRSLRTGLLHAVQAQQLQLLSMEPECVALWNHWQVALPRDAWLGLCRAGMLLLGVVVQGRLQGTRRLALDAPECKGKDWLESTVQREAARLNLPPPAALGLCGKPPTDWLGAYPNKHPGGLRCTMLGSACDALTLLGVTP